MKIISFDINCLVDKALEKEIKSDEGKPERLSPSMFGSCERQIWFRYKRTKKEKITLGKFIRRFILGSDQELGTVSLLEKAGFIISTKTENGEQHGFNVKDGKFVGYVDGIITYSPLENLVTAPCVFEHKIMKNDKFEAIERKGLKLSNLNYYNQIQLYMGFMDFNETLFVVYNTDTSGLYCEVVQFNKNYFDNLVNLGDKIVNTENPYSLPINPKECFFCDYRATCGSLTNYAK